MTQKLTNKEGGLVYEIIDVDYQAEVMVLKDPHTGTEFLLPDCRNVINLLGYEVQDADSTVH